jgi:lipopolysaccharide/colanic/teichoic acid biosynthesis glycosyltransferase
MSVGDSMELASGTVVDDVRGRSDRWLLAVGADDGITVLATPVPTGFYATCGKQLADRGIALIALLATLPLCLAVALAVRLSLGRGILFRQERVGRGGRRFIVLKFRTMLDERRTNKDPISLEERRACHKQPDDPRITRVGRFLRKWSLDELPQLWNVVRGDMSIVGPRPELDWIVDQYEPWQHARHFVRPGLTGLWQVSARGSRAMQDCVDLDVHYVDRLSFRLDLRILAKTPFAVIAGNRGH